nr:hypothetical protein [Tanacetum cinerariifolium]
MPVHIIVKDTRTIDMTIDQQVALDKALVPHATRLRIRKRNFCLRSNITSKESTLQLVYDVLRLTPFYKAFLVTADVPEIYTFDELPFKEEILAFIRFIGNNGEIKKLTDVNINKLHQPWRPFAAVINKCLSGKSTGYDSLRFTKVIIHYFMTKDTSIPRRNKFDVMLPIELTNEDIKNYEAYKEYYAVASGATPPKTKGSVRKIKSCSDTTITPPTATGTRLSTLAKATKRSLQQTHISQASGSGADEGTGIIPGVFDVPTDESDEEISWKSIDEDNDEVDEGSDDQDDDDDDQDDDDQDDNDDDQDTDNKGDDFAHPKLSIHEEEAKDEESFDPIVQTPPDAGIDSLFETTPRVDVQASTTVAPLTLTAPTLPPSTIPTISQEPQAPTPPTTAPSTFCRIF